MLRLVIPAAIIVVSVIIYAMIDCLMSRSRDVRSISKWLWLLIIVVLPVLGAAMWFAFGRPLRRVERIQPPVVQRPPAPEDDPQFLRNLELRRRQLQRDADTRRKAEELKLREQRLREDQARPSGSRDDAGGSDGTGPRPS